MTTRLHTLGGLRVHRDGQELTTLSGRPMQCALLVYMAVERKATRDAAMALLWPEKDRDRARGSLNNTAYELRSQLGEDWVVAHGDELRVRDDIDTDVGALASAVADGRFAEAVDLSKGGFLDGTHLARSTEFESWVDRQKSLSEQLERSAHRGLVEQLCDEAEGGAAVTAARKWANRVPLDDEAHYWLIRLLAESGHRADALTVYDRFRAALLEAFEVEPDETVQVLVDQIRSGALSGFDAPPAAVAKSPQSAPTPQARADRDGQTPAEVWRPHPGWGRKLLKSLGFYLVPGFGLLQVLGLLIENSVLSEELFRPALVLLLLGIPVITATAFLQSQPVDRDAVRGFSFVVARWFSWRNTALGGVAAVAAFAAAVVALPRPSLSWSRVPTPVAVVPFELPSSTEVEKATALAVAEAITEELHRWEGAVAASNVALSGARAELGIEASTLGRTDDVVALGRMVSAQAVVALSATVRGDSATIEVSLFDARSGRRAPGTILSAGLTDEPFGIAAGVVARVLGFGDLPNASAALSAGTTSADAAAYYLRGMAELERNRLQEAEAYFRSAVELDETFSSAVTRLAQTLYWRTEENRQLIPSLGPEIERLSAAAVDHLQGLSSENSLHVQGFHAFQVGAYDQAREHYEALLAADPVDVFALVMLGETEVHDRRAIRTVDGTVAPRSDLNRAWSSFMTSVDIRPTFELGYGQLFEIQRSLEDPLHVGACPIFVESADQAFSPWRDRPPTDAGLSFCPVADDSLSWLPRSELDGADKAAFRRGADRLFARSVGAFQRWAAIAPAQPRALDELSDAVVIQRGRLETAAPERLRALSEQALEYASQAAGVRSDTSSQQLARLANLHLAAGQVRRATDLARQTVDRHRSLSGDLSGAPGSLMNVLVVAGQSSMALEVASGYPNTHFVFRAGTDEPLTYAGGEPIVERLRALGSLGVSGPPLRSELTRLTDVWRIAGYSNYDQQLLRNHVTADVAASLVGDAEALAEWAAIVSVEDPIWQAVKLADTRSADALEFYDRALQEPSERPSRAVRAFLLGTVSGSLGRPADALAHFSRLDSIPHSVTRFDPGWGLQALSHLLRAEHYEQLGDLNAARVHFDQFLEGRSQADSLASPLVERAQGGLDRIR